MQTLWGQFTQFSLEFTNAHGYRTDRNMMKDYNLNLIFKQCFSKIQTQNKVVPRL